MTLFGKILSGIGMTGGAVAAVIAVYSWGESLKPSPLTKEEVREVVRQEISPMKNEFYRFHVQYIVDQNDMVMDQAKMNRHIINMDSSLQRHYRKSGAVDELLRYWKDLQQQDEKKNLNDPLSYLILLTPKK